MLDSVNKVLHSSLADKAFDESLLLMSMTLFKLLLIH